MSGNELIVLKKKMKREIVEQHRLSNFMAENRLKTWKNAPFPTMLPSITGLHPAQNSSDRLLVYGITLSMNRRGSFGSLQANFLMAPFTNTFNSLNT